MLSIKKGNVSIILELFAQNSGKKPQDSRMINVLWFCPINFSSSIKVVNTAVSFVICFDCELRNQVIFAHKKIVIHSEYFVNFDSNGSYSLSNETYCMHMRRLHSNTWSKEFIHLIFLTDKFAGATSHCKRAIYVNTKEQHLVFGKKNEFKRKELKPMTITTSNDLR